MARKNLRSTLNPWVHLTLQALKSPVNTWETEHKVQGGFREEKGRVKNYKNQPPIIICWNRGVIKENSRREEPSTKIKTKSLRREQRLKASANSLSIYLTVFTLTAFFPFFCKLLFHLQYFSDWCTVSQVAVRTISFQNLPIFWGRTTCLSLASIKSRCITLFRTLLRFLTRPQRPPKRAAFSMCWKLRLLICWWD